MRKLRPHGAFTLLELIVVIAIILVLAGGSVAVLGMFGKSASVKHAGRIIQSQFYRARQLAASTRVYHFLFIESVPGATPPVSITSKMTIYRDLPNGATPRGFVYPVAAGDDTVVGASVELPKGTMFKIAGAPPPCATPATAGMGLAWSGGPLNRGILILAFRPDGSIGAIPARADYATPAYGLVGGPGNPIADLVIAQIDNQGGVNVDYSFPAGKVMKILYDPTIRSGY